MYVRVRICMRVCARVHTCVYVGVCLCAYVGVYVGVCVCVPSWTPCKHTAKNYAFSVTILTQEAAEYGDPCILSWSANICVKRISANLRRGAARASAAMQEPHEDAESEEPTTDEEWSDDEEASRS